MSKQLFALVLGVAIFCLLCQQQVEGKRKCDRKYDGKQYWLCDEAKCLDAVNSKESNDAVTVHWFLENCKWLYT